MSITTMSGGPKFPHLEDMFLHYQAVMIREGNPKWDQTVAGEVYHRLQRVSWLEWQVRRAELELRDPFASDAQEAEALLAIATLSEAWYWAAFRTMRLIALKMPQLGKFEVLGITLTRNQLIEHAKEIFSANISIGDDGPVIKGPRWDGQSEEFPDAGLYTNARTFNETLGELLMPFVIRDAKEGGPPISSKLNPLFQVNQQINGLGERLSALEAEALDPPNEPAPRGPAE